MWAPDIIGRTANKGALLTWLCPMATAFFSRSSVCRSWATAWEGEESYRGRQTAGWRLPEWMVSWRADRHLERADVSHVFELTEFHLPSKVQRGAWTGY